MRYTISFPTGNTEYLLHANYSQLLQVAPVAHSIIITDNNIHRLYGHLFTDYRVLIIDSGESSKTWETIHVLVEKLAQFEAHKNTKLIAIGGGMITDIVGFLASIYMRGIPFAFVPTSLLGMVDAAIGGKNGINVGLYKNMLGTIRQPEFILFDTSFLETLPLAEWSNGFAEIIKYAFIKDASIFKQLSEANLNSYKIRPDKLNALIDLCVQHKNEIVLADEQEKHLRKTLNFGHTTGHAFETLYGLDHGHAVALGMIVALIASEQHMQLPIEIRSHLVQLLHQFGLPTQLRFDVDKVIQTLKRDKKRQQGSIDFILLTDIGSACIHPLNFDEIRQALQFFADAYKS